MARVFVTGSADGLGLLAGRSLLEAGHEVVLHARNPTRAEETRQRLPASKAVVVGDLASLAQTRGVAEQANRHGPFDAVIHSSGMHRGADASLDDVEWTRRRWRGAAAYAESKLCDVLLAFAVTRHWPSAFSNAVDPGWVPARMGGSAAPDDLAEGYRTQAWLAVSDDPAALVAGRYFYHLRPQKADPAAHDTGRQEKLLDICRRLSGVALDAGSYRPPSPCEAVAHRA